MDNPGLDSALDEKRSSVPDGGEPDASSGPTSKDNVAKIQYDHSFQNIVRNFTPSWFIITMSTGITSILLHQLPYNGHWLRIIADVFFVLNIVLWLTFLFISILRYTLYPQLITRVLHHPHQSLFLATMPIGLATIINMIILVCAPAWGKGWATFAWVLWWIDIVLALTACFHLTFVIMNNRRGELAEMTALYLIPIMAVVIVATSGGLIASAIPDEHHRLWTLIIGYILWGLGSTLSWIILTIYFLRLMVHKPLEREVIVTLLLPIGPLGLEGFSAIVFGKVATHLFPKLHALPHTGHTIDAGAVFYVVGVLFGLIAWGAALIWFVMAVVMIAAAGRFPFSMGWWGFIFPIGVFTLLTMTIGEELASHFFRILSCVLTAVCVALWLVVAVRTIQRSISGRMFYSPCLGTNLYGKQHSEKQKNASDIKEAQQVAEEV